MQHNSVLKKLNFDLLIPSVRGVGGGRVCGQNGSMTFGRKPFRRNDVWSNATFGRYDVSSITTFGRLRQLVENSSNLVEIWSKTDLYRKNKICLHLRFSHLHYS